MTFGPTPSRQTSWDWRAACNFIGGGAGGGLVAACALAGVEGAPLTILVAAGGALVAAGLSCVWLEIGRPWRALHVFFNPRSSWMSREAIAATLLLPLAACVAAGAAALAPLAALCALVFVYCQSRMLQAARGIPAWRDPWVPPLMVLTALAEGGGLLLASGAMPRPWQVVFVVLVLARYAVWVGYRRAVAPRIAPRALASLDGAGRVLLVAGTVLPLALVPAALIVRDSAWIALAAGISAALAGGYLKFMLVTRAGFNEGFALAHVPVRGVPRRVN